MVHGKGFTSAREAIQQAHLVRFYKLQVQYYDMLRHYASSTRIYTVQEKTILDSPPTFSKFDDSDDYNGFVPSSYYLETIWYKTTSSCKYANTLSFSVDLAFRISFTSSYSGSGGSGIT